jgi:hypothetical protein
LSHDNLQMTSNLTGGPEPAISNARDEIPAKAAGRPATLSSNQNRFAKSADYISLPQNGWPSKVRLAFNRAAGGRSSLGYAFENAVEAVVGRLKFWERRILAAPAIALTLYGLEVLMKYHLMRRVPPPARP